MDEFAVELACDFYVGILGWEFVYEIAKDIYDLLGEWGTEGNFPEKAMEFYLAFDESEMAGARDRKLIQEFLGQHRNLLP